MTEQTLAQVLDQPVARVETTLAELAAEYTAEGRGFDLRRAAGGWRYYTRAEQAAYVERFVLDGQQARLTQAALETLAVVAYQQPVTRSRISAIRGVNCDGVIRTLLTRGLVEEAGTEPETGAHLYRTTSVFLEKLGLDSRGPVAAAGAVPARATWSRWTRTAVRPWEVRMSDEPVAPAEGASAAGVGSRRACEEMIADGRVTVDGRVATLGDRVDPATAVIQWTGPGHRRSADDLPRLQQAARRSLHDG